jgi:putative ABC transport system substrate-binding protein
LGDQHRAALPKLIQIAREYKIPTISNVPNSVNLGILACHGYSQFAVGQTAGSLAAKILRGEGVGQWKVQAPEKAEILVNEKTAKILGLKVPSQFKKI